MGTPSITNVVNDLNLVNVDIPKLNDSNGEFAKTFDSVSKENNLGSPGLKDINVVDELKTSESVKTNYDKGKNAGSIKGKLENSGNKVESDKNSPKKLNNNSANAVEETDIEEAVEEAGNAIINAYCEMFNISLQDMLNFMEENGLTVMDLLNVDNIQAIVMQLNGITDSVEILTNDALFESIKDLEALTEENLQNLADELGIDSEELSEMIERMKADLGSEEENSHMKLEIGKSDTETVSIEGTSNNTAKEIKTEVQSKETGKDSSDKNNNSYASGNVSNDNQIQNNLPVNSEENAGFSTRAQEIYDQIGEYVRNLSTENLNELELKLQPETLGTIHIRVTQAEGVMKAEFITANENVRSIIEGQLIQLKEDFDRSGIRVDEVEVRVSTNEFNENTQSESRDEENERAARTSGVRRINIADGVDLDEIEEYEDDEKIAVEMMTSQGNTMDYKA
ncbi:MAG: flagellar hook-length control protein FliK [Lachnospiraceae bacterium]|nr:flagellar hook-length control protein FliK [Lachnospiraceae bacterium]